MEQKFATTMEALSGHTQDASMVLYLIAAVEV